MGIDQSSGMYRIKRDEAFEAFKFPGGIKWATESKYRADALSRFNPCKDPLLKQALQLALLGRKLDTGGSSGDGNDNSNNASEVQCENPAETLPEYDSKNGWQPAMSRSLGCMYGNVIGDSLGSPLEFSNVRYGSTELKDLEDMAVWNAPQYNRFELKPGQWTDDASMGLCIADCLLCNDGLNPQDLRLRFLHWWRMGYCNAFAWDKKRRAETRSGAGSVGLGGNISQSFGEFMQKKLPYTTAGNLMTCGNGSIMRNFALPIFYQANPEHGQRAAYAQSKTTHQGDEAAELCRLLTHICTTAINSPTTPDKKAILENLPNTFSSSLYSIQCLIRSQQEQRHPMNAQMDLCDRNWQWRADEYKYSPTRSRQQPGYIGSYAMDGMAMALHCLWTTDSFKAALLKCANIRGDADTVTAVVGQMAGAIYGIENVPVSWITCVMRWDKGGDCAVRAVQLARKGIQLQAEGKLELLPAVHPPAPHVHVTGGDETTTDNDDDIYGDDSDDASVPMDVETS